LGQSFVVDPFGRIIAKATADKKKYGGQLRSRQDRRDATELAVPAATDASMLIRDLLIVMLISHEI